ncbi:MAG TPA: aspartyl protease family protein [Pyrinomonadaceae bacterium]|nr:aspartyl protease family protein [Pyrinomonadaceae bacterium]
MRIKSFLLQTVVIASIGLTFYGSKGLAVQAPAAQARVASIPLEIAGENYVLIKARVNDFEPMTFILDSGAGSGLVLYHKAAELLKLRTAGKGKGGGAGATTYETALIKGASLSIAGVTMNNQTFVVYPPESPPPNLGQPVDGVIGYSLFSRYVVEIDYQSRVVNLYEPSAYQYAGGGESIPLEILSKVPFARVQIPVAGRKPLEGRFIVDSGAGRFSLILNAPVVASNNLLAVPAKIITEPGAFGVGGDVKLVVGRWPSLQIGHFTLTDPVIHFSQDRKGAFASSDFSGVIGGELLRRFKVIFDYAHKRMILEPNTDFSNRFDYDMSGIRLRAEGPDLKQLRVSRLVENSPAIESGLREGDLISAIDGRPATELSLTEISKMFKQEGRDYVLDIVRGEQKQQLKLKLKRLI